MLNGFFNYLSFCQDGSDSYNGAYSGGISFEGSSDHIINFTSNSNAQNVTLNLTFFVPCLLTLENGELTELLG